MPDVIKVVLFLLMWPLAGVGALYVLIMFDPLNLKGDKNENVKRSD